MDTLKAVIEKAQERTESETAYALGQLMGIKKRGRIYEWESGKRWPTDEEAAKLARLAEVPFEQVIAIRNAEKAKTAEDRDFWRNFRTHGMAAALAVLGLALSPAVLNLLNVVYYVKSMTRRILPRTMSFGLSRTA